MPDVKLLASWLDGDAFREAWMPLEEAEEFLLLSCYVTPEGLQALVRALRSAGVLRATLMFSLRGVLGAEAAALANQLYELVSQPKGDLHVDACLVRDDGKLFHPKAHGSRRGHQHRVVVGSANLTASAMDRNYELVSRIDNDPIAYQRLADAIAELKSVPARAIPITTFNRDLLIQTVQRRAATQPERTSAPAIAAPPVPTMPLPEWEYEDVAPPLSPAPPGSAPSALDFSTAHDSAEQALERIRELVSAGGFLSPLDLADNLAVPIHLDKFEDARIFRLKRSQSIGNALSMERSTGLSVHLLPPGLRARRKRLSGPLGRIWGRFSMDLLGTRWMPVAWYRPFDQHWHAQLAARGLTVDRIKSQIARHIQTTLEDLQPNGRYRQELQEAFEFQPIQRWNWPAACRLLDLDEEQPQRLTPKIRDLVFTQVVDHIRDSVTRQARTDYVLKQISGLGNRPRLRPVHKGSIDMWDALQVLAEWTQAASQSQFRYGTEIVQFAPNRSAFGQILLKQLGANALAAYHASYEWMTQVANADKLDPAPLLVAAWRQFSGWFRMASQPMNWELETPSYPSPTMEHPMGLLLLDEKRPFGPWVEDALRRFDPPLTRDSLQRIWEELYEGRSYDKTPLQFASRMLTSVLRIRATDRDAQRFWNSLRALLVEEGLLPTRAETHHEEEEPAKPTVGFMSASAAF